MTVKPAPGAVLVSDRSLRERNEDYVDFAAPTGAGHDDLGTLFILADGMGGHQAGDVASRTAVEVIKQAYVNGGSSQGLPPSDRLYRAVEQANARIYQLAAQHKNQAGMGTTAVVAVLLGTRLLLAHVGDSRAYVLHRDSETLEQVTKDHSLVQELIDAGRLDPDDAELHPQRKVVTRSLGRHEVVQVEISELQLAPGDLVLLCSDGLTRPVPDALIADVLLREPLDKAALTLVQRANMDGSDDPDNISLIVFQVPDPPAVLLLPVVLKPPGALPSYTRYLIFAGVAMVVALAALLVGPLVLAPPAPATALPPPTLVPSVPSDARASPTSITSVLTSTAPTPIDLATTATTLLPGLDLLSPADAAPYRGAAAEIVLTWRDPTSDLPNDEFYVVEIQKPDHHDPASHLTRSTIYTVTEELRDANQGQFEWQVYRARGAVTAGELQRTSAYGPTRSFIWVGDDTPTPTITVPPTQTPVPPTAVRTPRPPATRPPPKATPTTVRGGGTPPPTVRVETPPTMVPTVPPATVAPPTTVPPTAIEPPPVLPTEPPPTEPPPTEPPPTEPPPTEPPPTEPPPPPNTPVPPPPNTPVPPPPNTPVPPPPNTPVPPCNPCRPTATPSS